jgi:CHAT domain-containing protein
MKLDAERPGHSFARRAFETSERMRSRTLLDELAASRLDVRGRASQALLAKDAAVQARLKRLGEARSRAVAASAPLARLTRIEGAIRSANSDLETVRGKMRREDRLYRSIARPSPLGLRAIQAQVLDDETLLLAYSLGDEESFLWTVGRSSFHAYRLAGRRAIEKLADDASRCFVARDGCSERDVEQASARLSDAILRPAAAELAGRRILVAADGALQHIPFAALPDPGGTAGAPQRLVHGHEIVDVTSASLLPMLRRASARLPAPKLVAALGDPVFERDDRRIKGTLPAAARGTRDDADLATPDSGHVRLPRLDHTREEVERIVALAPPGLALQATDFDASRALVMSPEIGSYRYVHLATHVLLDPQDPELTGIVLSRYDAQGRPQDGFLHGYEVYGLKLSADLVVLSACETGLGPEVRGEGLIGLARGFMYAGAPRVLVSLWKVGDHATAELMLELYRGMIHDHLRPAAALRRAQIAMAKKYPSPYDWAAFQLQGDWR